MMTPMRGGQGGGLAVAILLLPACFADSPPVPSGDADATGSTSGAASATDAVPSGSSGSDVEEGPDGGSIGGSTTGTTVATESDSGTDTAGGADCPQSAILIFDEPAQRAVIDDITLPVFLSADEIDVEAALPGGAGIFFRTMQGEPLAHEIDTWRADGESVVWVGVPRIDTAHDRIELCYGGDLPPRTPSAGAFGPGFVGVWHFSDDAFGDAAELLMDSTVHENHGVATGPSLAKPVVAARLGRGVSFENFGETIEVAPSASLDVGAAITVEVLVRPAAVDGTFQQIVFREGAFFTRIRTTSIDGPSLALNLTSGSTPSAEANAPATTDWMYITGAFDADDATITVCLDGDACQTAPVANNGPINAPKTAPLVFGTVDAIVDEVRISDVRRSEAWLSAMARAIDGGLITFL